jgi:uncharacterized membrane protein
MKKDFFVAGTYDSQSKAREAIVLIKVYGLKNSEVSVLYSDNKGEPLLEEESILTSEEATTGTVAGATLGGILGCLAGIGTLAIPGVGPLIAAGPIMAALAGVGVGGMIGGISGCLVNMGISEGEAEYLVNRVNEGAVLVSVHTADEEMAERAFKVLQQSGAKDIMKKNDQKSIEAGFQA